MSRKKKTIEITVGESPSLDTLKKLGQKEFFQTSPNSQMRSAKAATIFRSKPCVEGPFYSGAMQCWRVQFYQRGETYHYSRESSIYIERLADAQHIADLMGKMALDTWEAWKDLVERARALPAWEGFCYVTGLGYGQDYLSHRK